MVTVVLASTPPELSVTVPVIPPRVRCACTRGVRAKAIHTNEVRRKTEGTVLFVMRARSLKLSRYTWPEEFRQMAVQALLFVVFPGFPVALDANSSTQNISTKLL